MGLINWVLDAASDIVDSYFVQTDLVDVEVSEEEHYETAHYDSMCQDTGQGRPDVPLGKRVY